MRACHSDSLKRGSLLTVWRRKATTPPRSRTARAIVLTFDTMSQACGLARVSPGAMNAFCKSTTINAVDAGFSELNPPRDLPTSKAHGGILTMFMLSPIGRALSQDSWPDAL